MKLHEYGIAHEESDIRAHVSLPGRRVTVFQTADMVALIERRTYEEKEGFQQGVVFPTAQGLCVPLDDIQPQFVLRSIVFPWGRWDHSAMDCDAKGDMAVACVKAAIIANRFPLWVCARVNDDTELDIRGTDIIVSAKRHIQVKYDGLAYPREDGGSGNLYIQTRECNPRKMYGSDRL